MWAIIFSNGCLSVLWRWEWRSRDGAPPSSRSPIHLAGWFIHSTTFPSSGSRGNYFLTDPLDQRISVRYSVSGFMDRHTSGRSIESTRRARWTYEVTRFLGLCPDLSWHDMVEGMDGLNGAEGTHTPNSHRYAVGQAWDAAREERRAHGYTLKQLICVSIQKKRRRMQISFKLKKLAR